MAASDDSDDRVLDLRDQPDTTADPTLPTWADWRPAHAATCRQGWCSAPAAEDSDWCAKHLDEVTAKRAAFNA